MELYSPQIWRSLVDPLRGVEFGSPLLQKFAKSSITQPGIVRFRLLTFGAGFDNVTSDLLQTFNRQGQRSKLQRDVTGAKSSKLSITQLGVWRPQVAMHRNWHIF